MYPPIYPTIAASSSVVALLKTGNGPIRFFQFGQAPQDGPYPYAVWQRVFGAPNNFLGDVPDSDNYTLQVDVYGKSAESVRNVAQALRDALETPLTSYITNWLGESRDPDTQNYRFSFQNEWLLAR